MPLLTSSVWLLGALLSFSLVLVVHSRDADPTENFCSLYSHMSRALSNLLRFHSLFADQRPKYIVTQKDGMLYIAGGRMVYPSAYSNYNGPSLSLL